MLSRPASVHVLSKACSDRDETVPLCRDGGRVMGSNNNKYRNCSDRKSQNPRCGVVGIILAADVVYFGSSRLGPALGFQVGML